MGYFNKIFIGTVLVALLLSLPFDVSAQTTIAKPPTPQEFTVQYETSPCYFHVTIKNIDYDLPDGYVIHYNIRILAYWNGYYDDGSYKWDEPGLDCFEPIQDPSGYTTIGLQQPVYKVGNKNDRIYFEVRAEVCHYETKIGYSFFNGGIPVDVAVVDAASDWSSPQSIALENGATGVPTSVPPEPYPTQTPTSYPDLTQTTTPYPQYTQPPQYTQNPTASSNIWNNQLTALINSHWEKLALLAMATIIAFMAVGLVLLWRKVGNIVDQKRPENSP